MTPMLNIAIRAARKAGNVLMKSFENPLSITVEEKSANNFITNVDRHAEHMIVDIIKKAYPKHTIISEESGVLLGKEPDYQWIIDPIDGTSNFIRQFPHFAVSIGVRVKNRTEVAVVYDPVRNELFSSSRGQGSQLNGYRLRGSQPKGLDGTILATGFPFRKRQHAENHLHLVSTLLEHCADFRCTGSTALDLAYVAAGRVDGFFEIGLKPWDITAGELLIKESGCTISDFSGGLNYFTSGNIVAAPPKVLKQILALFKNELSDELKK